MAEMGKAVVKTQKLKKWQNLRKKQGKVPKIDVKF